MKILFDANVPIALRYRLRKHEVSITRELGWSRKRNGDLLTAAESAGFDVLVTCDQNMKYQQNLYVRKIALVVLSTNHWPTLRPASMKIATTVDFVQRGQVLFFDVTSA